MKPTKKPKQSAKDKAFIKKAKSLNINTKGKKPDLDAEVVAHEVKCPSCKKPMIIGLGIVFEKPRHDESGEQSLSA